MHIESNLEKCVTRVTDVTLLGRLRRRRAGKSDEIQEGYVSIPITDPEVTEELSRHSVASLTTDQQVARENLPPQTDIDATPPPAPFKAADLADNESNPYSLAQLTAFAVSHLGIVVCPATQPYHWWWRERSWCANHCKTPCDRQVENIGVIQ